MLILAGAGAGKTKTITHRILALLKRGVAPENILAVTFTNKAAREMRERVRELIRSDKELSVSVHGAQLPFVSTFHALCVTLLREHSRLAGLPRHFTIYDRADSLAAIKAAMKERDIDPKQFAPRSMLATISRAKGDALPQQEYEAHAGNHYYRRIVADVWRAYEKNLRAEHALDFDDLLLQALELLKRHEAVRTHWQERFAYLHVDEYQDTNVVQYELLRILAEPQRNICCVGDIDQNIYAWRGATIDNILAFEKHYPEGRILKLEQNYRSTQTIVHVANKIIEKNVRRREKTLFTENPEGDRLTLFVASDEQDEAQYVANKARELIESGVHARDIAVLYRANFQSRALEEAMLMAGIPYQVLGTRFFERREVKDVLAFVRAALGRSFADVKRIINVPPRGIGKVTLLKLAGGALSELGSAPREKITAFYALLDDIKHAAQERPPSKTIRFTIERSGMQDWLRQGSEDDQERLENVRELVTLATKYDDFAPIAGIEKLLEEAALGTDQDELAEDRDAVRLMTIHAAKGLEFPHVFVTGLEEGLFPHERLDERADEEEERRLFYVALTRARQRLYLTYAGSRTIFGSRQANIPSQFITDIDEEFLEADERPEESARVIYIE